MRARVFVALLAALWKDSGFLVVRIAGLGHQT
jgi:hypothetical protein